MRRPIIAGNWKMYTTPVASSLLASEILSELKDSDWADLVVFPPFTSLFAVISKLNGGIIQIGSQNMHWEKEGAFTGEISPEMIASSGCQWVLIGHSERRLHFGETDDWVQKKIDAAFKFGLKPILCIGETIDQRKAEETKKVVYAQIQKGLMSIDDISSLVIAYEPVWAIGTGHVATPEQAQEVHQFIRGQIAERWTDTIASGISIIYGGSVKPDNAQALWNMPDIDGFLIGGASLKAESFSSIARAVRNPKSLLNK